MLTLVTGATGLLGNNVVRTLLERGQSVRALTREGSDPRPIKGLDIEVFYGDVRDFDSVSRACKGVDLVIHSAGWVHIGRTGMETARQVNVEGTRNVAAAALAGSAKLVHVSSTNALGVGSPEVPATEETPRVGQIRCPYTLTKQESEEIVLEFVRTGLHATIVNPGFMLGPWDWKPSSGRMVLEVARRFTPVAPRGGCSLCDVRDVSAGIIAAAERGRPGRNYVLAGANMTYFDIWHMIAQISGCRGPAKRVGRVASFIGGKAGDILTRLTGREPDVNSAAMKITSQYHYYDSRRAEKELGYRSRPPEKAAEAAWQWFREHGYTRTC